MSGQPHSPAAKAASLRPRTKRLISIEGDDGATQAQGSSNSLQQAVSSAFSSSRDQSPIPSSHPSRATSATRSPQQQQRSVPRTYGLQIPAERSTKHTSIWASSWSSLQGVTSTLLGSNIDPSTPTTPGGTRRGSGKGARAHRRNYSLNVPEQPWGPQGSADEFLAAGSREERQAKVQAEKRKVLLSGVGDEQRDALGHYKRRSSLDRRDSIPSPTLGDDALVYIHHVLPNDSVAGLSVKYNCPQAVVRKSNRLWANDTIQTRKYAFLPVEACALRGRKVEEPGSSALELLAGTEDTTVQGSRSLNGTADYHIASSDPTPQKGNIEAADKTWTTDSWVVFPNSPRPVEIGRVPRRTLGWFPPARRKSVTYSDTSPPLSVASDTPPANAASALTSSAHTSPGRGISPARRPTRPSRTSSSASRLNPQFPSAFLRGIGGVGSLHSSVHGPPPDELNKFVQQHIPQLAIQDADAPNAAPGTSSAATAAMSAGAASRPLVRGPRVSFDRISVASGGSGGTAAGVEAMAGAVEGWMRKVGGKVKGSLGTPEMRGRGRANTADGGGDLIELTESWDLNGGSPGGSAAGAGPPVIPEDAWESEGHGVLAGASARGRAVSSSARDEEEKLLRERFPPAGRVFEEQGKKRA